MGWWSRNVPLLRELGLGGASFACAIGTLTVGGDMQLVAILLSAALVSGSIGIATAPERQLRWRIYGTALLVLFFIGEGGYTYWHFHGMPNWAWLQKWQQHRASPVKAVTPQPVPPPPAPPAPPPAPWVSSEEIAAQQKLGHILLKFSPDKLIAMEAAGNNIQLYLNNWVKIDYPIAINPTPYSDKKKEYDAVEMTAVPTASIYPIVRSGIIALFDPKKWSNKLLAFSQGDRLKAYCRLREILPGTPTQPYNIRMDVMIVDECELPEA
jgi:hypothetical protein